MPNKGSNNTASKVCKTKPVSKQQPKAKIDKKETETTAVVKTASPLIEQINTIQDEIVGLSTQLRALTSKLKLVKKEHLKSMKQLEKLQKKKKKSGGTSVKHQSGIAKPGFISPQLCDFIGVSKGTELARTEVIKYVNRYIKDNQLQDQENKKVIVPDAKLQTLLQSSKDDEITYFNLQTYMKPHYVDPSKASSVVS